MHIAHLLDKDVLQIRVRQLLERLRHLSRVRGCHVLPDDAYCRCLVRLRHTLTMLGFSTLRQKPLLHDTMPGAQTQICTRCFLCPYEHAGQKE